jgi:hypothetical protein
VLLLTCSLRLAKGLLMYLASVYEEAASGWVSTAIPCPSGRDTEQTSLTLTTFGLTGGEEGQGPSWWGSIYKQSPILEDRLEQ